jgi:hypothetical protein
MTVAHAAVFDGCGGTPKYPAPSMTVAHAAVFDGTAIVCPRRAILREFRTIRGWTKKPME